MNNKSREPERRRGGREVGEEGVDLEGEKKADRTDRRPNGTPQPQEIVRAPQDCTSVRVVGRSCSVEKSSI